MSINYYGHDVCEKHWQAYCDGAFDLKQKLHIREDGQQTLR
jgi:hypothetical protein